MGKGFLYERRQRRYDEQYEKAEIIETQMDEWNSRLLSVRQEKISADNVYQLLLAFDKLYDTFTEVEQRDFMRAFIERIDIYPEKPDKDSACNEYSDMAVCMDGG